MRIFKRWFIISTVLFFAFSNRINAQSLSVGLLPSSLLGPISPSLDIAVEYGFHPKWSIEGVYRLNVGFGLFNWIPDPNASHQEYRLLLKHHFSEGQTGSTYRF